MSHGIDTISIRCSSSRATISITWLIVRHSSSAALKTAPGNVTYAASKGGIISAVKGLSHELVRDQVRVYNGAVRFPMTGQSPQDYAENMARMKAAPEGFTLIKQGIGFHSPMAREVPDFFYGTPSREPRHGNCRHGTRLS